MLAQVVHSAAQHALHRSEEHLKRKEGLAPADFVALLNGWSERSRWGGHSGGDWASRTKHTRLPKRPCWALSWQLVSRRQGGPAGQLTQTGPQQRNWLLRAGKALLVCRQHNAKWVFNLIWLKKAQAGRLGGNRTAKSLVSQCGGEARRLRLPKGF